MPSHDVITKWSAELTVQGNSVSLPSGSASYAAIDTGTTLVGGSSSQIQNIYAQIPGSQPGTGNWQGFWLYRTSSSLRSRFSLYLAIRGVSVQHQSRGHHVLWGAELASEPGRFPAHQNRAEYVCRGVL